MSPRSEILKRLNLEVEKQEDSYRTYAGAVTLPAADFRVAVTGTDENGFPFQRVQKRLVVKER